MTWVKTKDKWIININKGYEFTNSLCGQYHRKENIYSRVAGKLRQKLHISDRKSDLFIGIGYTPIVVE